MNAQATIIEPIALDPAPIEIDPRPCGRCGLAVDRHVMVDDGDGPEFFCAESDEWLHERLIASKSHSSTVDRVYVRGWNAAIDFALEQLQIACDEPPQWFADSIMSHCDDAPSIAPEPAKRYRTPQATIDAFKYLARQGDAAHLKAWLNDRRQDAPYLLSLLERDHVA
jgi:hypothetical protein